MTRWMSSVAAGVVVLAAGTFAIVNAVGDDDKPSVQGFEPPDNDNDGNGDTGVNPGPGLGPQFSPSTMPDNVSAIIAQAPVTADNSETAGEMSDPAKRDACAGELVDDGRDPIAVQAGSYNGDDAFAFVFSDQTDDNLVDVYVVDASCSPDFDAQDLQR